MQCGGEWQASFGLWGVCEKCDGAGGVGKACVCLSGTGILPGQTGQKWSRALSPVVAFTGVCGKSQDLPFLKGRREDPQHSSPLCTGEGSGAGVPLFKLSHRSWSANSLLLAS